MARRISHPQDDADVDVTPLLDIVFIMLIFFIVTAVFIDESGIAPNLPQKSDDDNTKPPPSLLLTVQENGSVLVDNTSTIDPRSVGPRVEEFLAKEAKGVIVISAMGDAKAGDTMLTLDQARDGATPARYDKITLTPAGE
ncbi:biopolymer transporter ExbD [Parvularcula sp. LCG005]|uniref:ExbD/TolR family protein n=1 Tax=Parvularcula sp. LCG005 TaxID=3078805 RepID=UPI002941D668|nr:biopolymer transporter ExbD [Parvularcula sp. LCG005]WOI53623.1 biopolymer transporter ExbD [Parvularcula sp. LCG005]